MQRTPITTATTDHDTAREPKAAIDTVPFFARKVGRPLLVVRSALRAGAATEESDKRHGGG